MVNDYPPIPVSVSLPAQAAPVAADPVLLRGGLFPHESYDGSQAYVHASDVATTRTLPLPARRHRVAADLGVSGDGVPGLLHRLFNINER